MTTLSDNFTLPQTQVGPGSNVPINNDFSWKPDLTTAFITDTRQFSIDVVPVSTNALTIVSPFSGLNVIISNTTATSNIIYTYSPPQDLSLISQTIIRSNAGGTSLLAALSIEDTSGAFFNSGLIAPDSSGNFIFNFGTQIRNSVDDVRILFKNGNPQIPINIIVTSMTSINILPPPPPISTNNCGY